jgi:hypothetical protein
MTFLKVYEGHYVGNVFGEGRMPWTVNYSVGCNATATGTAHPLQ